MNILLPLAATNNVTVTTAQAVELAAQHLRAGQLAQAEQIFGQILSQHPDHADALHGLGLVAYRTDRGDAVVLLRRAVSIHPDPHTYNSLGTALHKQGQLDEAVACYRAALELQPDHADANVNLGAILLLQGELEEGFVRLEWRAKSHAGGMWLGLPQPRWDGGPLAGRTLFLHYEQGLGDTLMLVRYTTLILEREPGAKIVLDCQRELKGLLTRSLPRCRIISAGDELPVFDVHCPLMSLPTLLGTTLETVPCRVPYLKIDPDKGRAWRQTLRDGTTARRVGLAWAGARTHLDDSRRSLSLPAFAPLGLVPRVAFHSLQKGDAAAQARQSLEFRLHDHAGELHDFDETAALIANLQLVITVDTSVAHLAGALNKPVWVLLPFLSDWRWRWEGTDSPWYPSMRLFRQKQPGQWQPVIAEVAAALASLP